jgi:hypothetical protein
MNNNGGEKQTRKRTTRVSIARLVFVSVCFSVSFVRRAGDLTFLFFYKTTRPTFLFLSLSLSLSLSLFFHAQPKSF